MKKSLKKAILFSTLAFGTLEATSVVSNNTATIAHADITQTVSDQSNNVVTSQFSDPGMQNVILVSAQSQYGNRIKSLSDITQSDFDNLTTLSYPAWYKQISISSLSNIDKLTSLKSINFLNINFDANINLSPIKKLTNLTNITIKNAGITSNMINNLSGYNNPNLTNINLSANKITNIDFIKSISIPNISEVDISNNQISDFSPIEGVNWPELTDLDASNNQISDISPIAKVNWPKLTNLNASGNNISDISVIKNANWPLVNSIDVSYNNISDINPISTANWPNLEYIIADNNHIKNIDSFVNTNWTKLKSISVNNNDINNIDAMKDSYKKFTNLSDFSVDNNQISDLSFMEGFKFDGGSAKHQSIVKNVTLKKPQKGETVSIPVKLVDLDLSDNYLGKEITNPDKQYLLISELHDSGLFTVIGKNGKPYKELSNGDYQPNISNGIDHINFTYEGGDLPNSVTFHFDSSLGIGSTYFSGNYSIALNWQDTSSTNNNEDNNYKDSNNTIDTHKNNSGNPTSFYEKVIATRGLNLYKKNVFTKSNRIKHFKKTYGQSRPLFKVLKKVSSSINTPRFYVVQIDPRTHKEIKHSRGYITAKSNYVTPLYYTKGIKAVRVLNKTINLYKKDNLNGYVKKYKRGTVLKVKSIKKHGNAYSLQLQNGNFITANKYFVIKIK